MTALLVCIICLFLSTSDSAFSDGAHKKLKQIQQMSLFPSTSKYHPNQDGLKQRRRWLVVDFDGTCTEADTTPLLPRLAASYATRQRSSNISEDNNADDSIHQQDLERRLSQFQQLEDTYMKLLADAKSSLSNNEKTEYQSIHDVLHSLDEPSIKVTNMVSESRVLEGLGRADSRELREILQLNDVSDKGEEEIAVRLRQGCESTLARILIHKKADEDSAAACLGWSLAVLSINWSPNLIDAVLTQQVLKKRRTILQIDSCDDTDIPVWSNSVDEHGVVSLHVPGALAKRDRIMELRRHIHEHDSSKSSVIVYVGDSSTDLAALLEADVGLIMGQSATTSMIAQQWGVQILPLKDRSQHGFGSDNACGWREKKILWQVESWYEINELLIELDEYWSK